MSDQGGRRQRRRTRRRRKIEAKTGIVFALDVDNIESALEIAAKVEPYVDAIKISWPLVMANGAGVISLVRDRVRLPLISDFKVGDIPETSGRIIRLAVEYGSDGVTLHGFVGNDTLKECIRIAHEGGSRTFVVTEMSHPGAELFMQPVGEKIARLARDLGSDGIVAPATRPERTREYRRIVGDEVMIMSPGVGAQGASPGDAIRAGANFEVIGRRIYEAKDPGGVAKNFSETIARVMDEQKENKVK
jgi:orotidine-5'-phosphate decarboxylase